MMQQVEDADISMGGSDYDGAAEENLGDIDSLGGESSNHDKKKKKGKDAEFVKRETGFVRLMRGMVIIVLLVATVLVSIGVFTFLRGIEEEQLEEDFVADANKVLFQIGKSVDLTLTAADSLATTMVSYAKVSNSTYPFVTIPDFELRSGKIRRLAKAVWLALYLRVEHEERADWEAYTVKHGRTWVDASLDVQEKDPHFHGALIRNYTTVDYLHGWDSEVPVQNKSFYYATWQNSPAVPRWPIYNFDAVEWYTDPADVTEDGKYVRIGSTYQLPDPDNEEELFVAQEDADWFRDYIAPDRDPLEPALDVTYPILKEQTGLATVPKPEEFDSAGVLVFTVMWRDWLENILPSRSIGVVAVFDNECNPTFSFQLDGPQVTYLGRGDQHDPTFDKYLVSSWLLDVESLMELDDGGERVQRRAGVPIDGEDCPYVIRLYPSTERQDEYISSRPLLMAIVAAGIFLFTSFVFIGYDRVVELRQRKVVRTAKQTSDIVDQLYPSAVRDRLIDSNQKKQEQSASFGNAKMFEGKLQKEPTNAGPPIADKYNDVTCFFGDLAGFTAWSSVREPAEVFELLETIYGAFDRLAKKRRVFKVETVGDCYVAVTGIPDAQPDHAVRMCKFADEVSTKMNHLVAQLAVKFGDDTLAMKLRVGLHSGPVTAGVLRGDKGRFQLFGDTVNTASRMESTGVPGRIQVSQSTADLLAQSGKESWCTAREQVIVAKGKGEMKTYFLQIKVASESLGTNSTFPIEQAKSIGSQDLDSIKALEERLAMRNTRNFASSSV